MKKVFIAFALMLTVLAGGATYKTNIKPVAKHSTQMVAEQDPWGIPAPTITLYEQDPWG